MVNTTLKTVTCTEKVFSILQNIGLFTMDSLRITLEMALEESLSM